MPSRRITLRELNALEMGKLEHGCACGAAAADLVDHLGQLTSLLDKKPVTDNPRGELLHLSLVGERASKARKSLTTFERSCARLSDPGRDLFTSLEAAISVPGSVDAPDMKKVVEKAVWQIKADLVACKETHKPVPERMERGMP